MERRNFLRALAVGAAALAANCAKNPVEVKDPVEVGDPAEIEHNLPSFSGIYETPIAGNLESPSGLSSGYMPGLNKVSDTNLGVFAQGPLRRRDVETGRTDYTKSRNPTINQIIGDIASPVLDSTPLTEFNLADYSSEFHTSHYYGSIGRPIGLTLDSLVMGDGSILVSSNVSDKLFKVDYGQIQVFLEDNGLYGITDMVLAGNGKIYAIQEPILEWAYFESEGHGRWENTGNILRNKRVISIDSFQNIITEFELPTSLTGQIFEYKGILGDGAIMVDEMVKIVENSEIGKEKFGTEFYVSDLLEKAIYKVDAYNNVELLMGGIRYPSSIMVDDDGNIFYTTSPLWLAPPGPTDIEYPTELHVLNPKTLESVLLHVFDERDIHEYVTAGGSQEVEYNGQNHILPVGFNVSHVLYDTVDKMNFLLTNSHQGTLKKVEAVKGDKF